MQSEPSTISKTATHQHPTQEHDNLRQYGISHNDPSTQQSHGYDTAGPGTAAAAPPSPRTVEERQRQLAVDEALARALQDADATNSRVSGAAATTRTPSPPVGTAAAARNRVEEYEKASITPPASTQKKRQGPAFEVIKKPRAPGDRRSPIQDLPNEVLTHAVAHLSPDDLASVALVSKRFHSLVTGPHAWRSAFAHYFPGQSTLDSFRQGDCGDSEQELTRSEKRAFTRLTALCSWRSEYIMRTRLLRSLARGKPVQAISPSGSNRSGANHNATPVVMYNSQLFTTINHLHANFGSGLNKKLPRFIHGADDVGMATSSDPQTMKVDNWGLSDPQQFLQFIERFPGDTQYGLGPGEVIGIPNVMDVSQPFGMIHGEGSPGGTAYFRSADEMRGRFLASSSAMSVPELGIPRIASVNEAVTSVWIAKSSSVPSLTDGLIGILCGSSLGVVTAYSLGSTHKNNSRDQRFVRGEMTARWALSPGVPIIAISVDPDYSLKRHAQNRIWAVALNALGEVFYLTKFPNRPADRGVKLDDEATERIAWLTGRTVYWNIVEPSRRTARPDPYADNGADGSYSPRSSWTGMCLTKEQISAETHEIEAFAERKPKDFRKFCIGWDMRRKLEVDFAGDDGNHAGESAMVIACGLDEDTTAAVIRYTRCRFRDRPNSRGTFTPPLSAGSTVSSSSPSLFGSPALAPAAPIPGLSLDRLEHSLRYDDITGSLTPRPMSEEWRESRLSFHGLKHVQITATAIDSSLHATQTISEDPLLSLSGMSATSSPTLSPLSSVPPIANPSDVPGQRARLIAVGTKMGSVLLWNVRSPSPRSAHTVNTIDPVRIIHTDSPQVSCLALSSLYLVHGGNDGLVQAWDPLGSTLQPIRTLHSRFSSRARRRLVQAQASPQGVGINLFAAGALCLDPDPTVLRGMVSLGTHLRYWSYSSSAADQYKSQKRRLRRSERGSNNGGERFSGATRSNLKDYIANEKYELDREKEQRRKDADRFAGRFGTELMDGSEEEMIAYAAMLSQETLEQENSRRESSDTSTVVSTDHSAFATDNPTPSGSTSPRISTPKSDAEFDADLAEAIRQSLAASPSLAAYDVPIRQAKPKRRAGSSARPSPRPSPMLAGSSRAAELNDLDFALQLSLAEEQSKAETAEDYPTIGGQRSLGRGKNRMG